MKIPTFISGLFLPILRCILTPLPGFRLLLIKLCVILEEDRAPKESLRWLFTVHAFTEAWIDRKAIAWGDGIHIKHTIMDGIHTFFCDRIPVNAKVLDVGCGIGALANEIAQSVDGVRVIGIDSNSDHIQFAKERYTCRNLAFIEGDATRDLPESPIDIVVLSSVLEHVVERVQLLEQLSEIYKPICFLIRVPAFERHFHAAMKRELGVFPYVDQDHKVEYTMSQFTDEIESAGLTIASIETRWGDIWAECQPFDKHLV